MNSFPKFFSWIIRIRCIRKIDYDTYLRTAFVPNTRVPVVPSVFRGTVIVPIVLTVDHKNPSIHRIALHNRETRETSKTTSLFDDDANYFHVTRHLIFSPTSVAFHAITRLTKLG